MAQPDDLIATAAAHLRSPGLVVLTGPPGAGRTTLLRAVADRAPGPVHAGGGLAMLAGVPALGLSRAVRARLPGHDIHLLAEAVRSRVRGGLLIFDDLQYADPATLAALPLLAAHCRVLVALRTPHRLAVPDLRAAATAWLEIPPLGRSAAADLIRRTAPQLDDDAVAAVRARAGGNPLALTALARHAAAGRGPAGAGIDQVAYAIATALADLARPARTALAALGLLGRPAPAALLGPGAADLVTAGLAAATPGGLLPVSTYLAETAAGLLDAAARTDLHRRLADLTPPAEAARHLAAAGDRPGAYRHALTAADRATGGDRAALLLFACDLGVPVHPRVRVAAADALLAAGRPAAAARVLDTPEPLGVEADVLHGEALLQAGKPAAARTAVRPVPDAAGAAIVAARDRVLLLADLATDPGTAGDTADKVAARYPVPPPAVAAALAAVRAAQRDPGWDVELAAAAGLSAELAAGAALSAELAAAGAARMDPAPPAGAGAPGPAARLDADPARSRPADTTFFGHTSWWRGAPDRLTSRWSAWLLVEHLAADGRLVESATVARAAATACAAELAYGWQTRFVAAADWAEALHGTTTWPDPPAPGHAVVADGADPREGERTQAPTASSGPTGDRDAHSGVGDPPGLPGTGTFIGRATVGAPHERLAAHADPDSDIAARPAVSARFDGHPAVTAPTASGSAVGRAPISEPAGRSNESEPMPAEQLTGTGQAAGANPAARPPGGGSAGADAVHPSAGRGRTSARDPAVWAAQNQPSGDPAESSAREQPGGDPAESSAREQPRGGPAEWAAREQPGGDPADSSARQPRGGPAEWAARDESGAVAGAPAPPGWGDADAVQRRAADLTDRAVPLAARGYATAAAALVEADTGLLAAARARLDAGPEHPATAWVAREAAWLDGQPDRAAHPPTGADAGLLAGLHRITARWAAHDTGVAAAGPIPAGLPPVARRTLLAWATGTGFPAAARAWTATAVREQIRCLLAAGLLDDDPEQAVAALLVAERLADAAGLTVLAGRARRGLRRHRVHRDTRSPRSGSQLTRRETDVLRLVAAGEPSRRIAGQLGISAETVDTHIRAGMRKLGARTRTEAAALAFAGEGAR